MPGTCRGFLGEGAFLSLAWILGEAEELGLGIDWHFIAGGPPRAPPYSPNPLGTLYDSRNRFKETITFRNSAGRRDLLPSRNRDGGGERIDANAAGLALDCSVLKRIGPPDPRARKKLPEPYGPTQKNLLEYFSGCSAHDDWVRPLLEDRLRLDPADELTACLPVAPNVSMRRSGPHVPDPERTPPERE